MPHHAPSHTLAHGCFKGEARLPTENCSTDLLIFRPESSSVTGHLFFLDFVS